MKKLINLLLVAVLIIALPVSTYAAAFTPSVSQKGAPEVVEQEDETGEIYVAEIVGPNGEVVARIPRGGLLVTPLAEAADAPDYVEQRLMKAYNYITVVKSLDRLIPGLQDALTKMGVDIPAKNLVVQDLFDVSVSGDYIALLAQEGNKLVVRFETTIGTDELMLIAMSQNGEEWYTVDAESFERHDNGDVTIEFDSYALVAFVVDAPQGDMSPMILVGVGMILGSIFCLVIFFIIVAAKKKKKNNDDEN